MLLTDIIDEFLTVNEHRERLDASSLLELYDAFASLTEHHHQIRLTHHQVVDGVSLALMLQKLRGVTV